MGAKRGQGRTALEGSGGWSEAQLHGWLLRRFPRGRASEDPRVGSLGHDAAVLRALGGRAVLCVDQTIEGVHFEPGTSGRRAGTKAAARALSDLAATAAEPVALLLALAAPRERSAGWLRAAIEAVDRCGREHGAVLVGGDLALTPGPLVFSVSALGRSAGRRRPPGRDRARPGDVLLITGPVGGSGLGRHLRIEPRVAEGRWLWEHGARALMDVSDGLALDASRLAGASGVRIELDDVPLHRDARRAAVRSGRTPEAHALGDGEDHELLATMPAARWRSVAAQARRRFPRLRAIGRVLRGAGLWRAGGPSPVALDAEGGWVHGG